MTIDSALISSEKVLIADDDEPTRILLRTAISKWGYQVIEATHGEQAWDLLQQPDAPKLLVVDWLMPQLDGLALCERIRNQLVLQPYIIFLTRLSGTPNILKGLEAGADEFLIKPVNYSELHIRLLAGERIVKYRDIVISKNQELQVCLTYINTLEQLLYLILEGKK
ncbi:MAG: hypothetical protein A3F42_02435 [Gammaproteobacteria bacterium RIFCSPHIGHO2_12_FULL_37_34]|nr:MAG: hypothetical protein A3F42_02435 [Gammaproteobacteria bacterium RIFCSPHIGHO2_12_FULL_37_34]